MSDDKPRRGRPPKLTPELLKRIIRSVRLGNYPSVVCKAMGVHRNTYERWKRNGKNFPDGIYGAFRRGIREAWNKWEESAVRRLNRAGKEDPAVLFKMLACTRQDRWGGYNRKMERMEAEVAELKASVAASAGQS